MRVHNKEIFQRSIGRGLKSHREWIKDQTWQMPNDGGRRKGKEIEKEVDENGKICERISASDPTMSGRLIIRLFVTEVVGQAMLAQKTLRSNKLPSLSSSLEIGDAESPFSAEKCSFRDRDKSEMATRTGI